MLGQRVSSALEVLPRRAERVRHHSFEGRPNVFDRVDESHLSVEARELSDVADRVGRLGPERRGDLEDPLKSGSDEHLLVQLRALGEVGPAVEVVDREEGRAALGALTEELGGFDLEESSAHERVAEPGKEARAQLEDRSDRRFPEVEDPMVEPRVELGAHLVDDAEWKRDLGPTDHLDRGREELDSAVRALRPADLPLDREDRLARQVREEREERGVGGPLLERDLGGAAPVPNERERNAAERAVIFEMSRDPDDLAVQRSELTREPAGWRQGSRPPYERSPPARARGRAGGGPRGERGTRGDTGPQGRRDARGSRTPRPGRRPTFR